MTALVRPACRAWLPGANTQHVHYTGPCCATVAQSPARQQVSPGLAAGGARQRRLALSSRHVAQASPEGPSTSPAAAVPPSPAPGGDVASSQEDLSALQLDMDRMSQEAWRLSSALSATRQDNAALQSALAVAEDQLAALQAQAGEHSQLALAYDKLCQDFYKLRMSLQASQEQRGDAAEDAAGELAALRADMTWLQKDHRTSLAAAHQEQELLAAEVRRLRLSLLESQQALWAAGAAVPASHTGSSSSSSSSSSVTGGSSGSSSSSNRTSQQKDGQSGPATTALSSPSASTSAPAEDTAGQQATPGAGSGLTPLAATATSEEPSSALQEQQQVPSAEVEALQLQLQQALASAEEERAALAGEVQALSRQAALRELELASLRAQVAAAQQQQEQAPRAATGVEQGGELGLMDADLVGRLQSALEERGSLQEQLAAAQAQVGTLQQQLSAASASLAAPAATSVAAGLVGLEGKQVLAQARVEAGEARRAAAAAVKRAEQAEAALAAALQEQQQRIADLQRWYGRQVAVAGALRRGRALPAGLVEFSNQQRFWVPRALLFDFLKRCVEREAALAMTDGFLGLQVTPSAAAHEEDGVDVAVVTHWSSIPAWEAWSTSEVARRLHLPDGTYQYVPNKGEGFPEDFLPFRDLDAAVSAKY